MQCVAQSSWAYRDMFVCKGTCGDLRGRGLRVWDLGVQGASV